MKLLPSPVPETTHHWEHHLQSPQLTKPPLALVSQILVLMCAVMSGLFASLWTVTRNPPGSSAHGDSPGKNTGVGFISSSGESSRLKDQTWVSCTAGGLDSLPLSHPQILTFPQFTAPKTPNPFLSVWSRHHSVTPFVK